MAPTQQDLLRECLVARWSSLRSDRALVDALKSTPLLVEAQTGRLRCASHFLDPEVPALKLAFDDAEGRFPGRDVARSAQWLTMLREIGLRSEVDGDLFLECVQHVEAAWRGASESGADAVARAATAKAEKLLKFLWQNFAQLSQGSPAFWTRLAQVAIVPVAPVAPAGGTLSAHLPAAAPPRVLVTYSACATPKDGALAWTVLPIVPDDVVRPRLLFCLPLFLFAPFVCSILLLLIFCFVAVFFCCSRCRRRRGTAASGCSRLRRGASCSHT
jgi:hypothetical protein